MFFLALALWAAFAVFVARLGEFLRPLSPNPGVALSQSAMRFLLAAVLSSMFYGVLAFFVIRLTQRSVRSRQWPPPGMRAPFRTAIREIRRPHVEWALTTLVLCSLLVAAVLPWLRYAELRRSVSELSVLLETPNPSIERTAAGKPASAAHVER
jgi:hypothetical protein